MTRRDFLKAVLALPPGLLVAGCLPPSGTAPQQQPTAGARPADGPVARAPQPTFAAQAAQPSPAPLAQGQLAPTPSCPDDRSPTTAQTEGPFFKPSTPLRTSLLEPGIGGSRLVLTGHVLTTACQPVRNALLDFWQADGAGNYDNAGFRLRGHQFTDDSGRYSLETVLPGLYPGRTRHLHVKVQVPNQPVLTTQLYFPNEARNRSDGIFHPRLVVAMQDAPSGKAAQFDFVLNSA